MITEKAGSGYSWFYFAICFEVGNKLLGIGNYFWDRLELWQFWAIFVF
ncbi:MAG: hypothetical protein V2I31_11340 [Mariniphaga sp.]|nr:hypothetical protein [Mariniphaga sp.]